MIFSGEYVVETAVGSRKCHGCKRKIQKGEKHLAVLTTGAWAKARRRNFCKNTCAYKVIEAYRHELHGLITEMYGQGGA